MRGGEFCGLCAQAGRVTEKVPPAQGAALICPRCDRSAHPSKKR